MTKTRVKPETKEQTETRLQKLTNIRVGEYEDRNSEGQWKLADWVHELYVMYRSFWGVSTKEKIRELLNKGYCHKHNIHYGQAREDKDYHVFRSTITRIIVVACREEEAYQKDRNSGRKCGRIWKELIDKKKLTPQEQRIADGKESPAHKDARIEKQKKAEDPEGFKIEQVDTSYHKPKEDPNKTTSKSVFIIPEDVRWKRECLSIARDNPRLFMEMVEEFLGLLLSQETIAAIRKDLFKS